MGIQAKERVLRKQGPYKGRGEGGQSTAGGLGPLLLKSGTMDSTCTTVRVGFVKRKLRVFLRPFFSATK